MDMKDMEALEGLLKELEAKLPKGAPLIHKMCAFENSDGRITAAAITLHGELAGEVLDEVQDLLSDINAEIQKDANSDTQS